MVAVGHTAPQIFSGQNPRLIAALLANLNCLVLDFVARQKIGGLHLTYTYLRQLPLLAPHRYSNLDQAFIARRVLELTYTAHDLSPWARDLGYEGQPFVFEATRRALLRAELDAYYARLYGLTREELQYILDPKAVMGTSYPSETFRVLKEREKKELGRFRTAEWVLDAWDRLEAGTLI